MKHWTVLIKQCYKQKKQQQQTNKQTTQTTQTTQTNKQTNTRPSYQKDMEIKSFNNMITFLCPRHSKNGGGALSVTLVRASVRPSVCPCVRYHNLVSA